MKKIEIITDEHRHHVYVGNTDFLAQYQGTAGTLF
nr:MAG TPA: hypothetical protein [Caudoviricetes sp.]